MIKDFARGFLGTVTPAGGIALSFEQAVSPWLRLIALLIGVVTGVMMFIALWKSNRQKQLLIDLRIASHEAELCHQCLIGHHPTMCPLPDYLRPKHCPKRRSEWEKHPNDTTV